MRDLVGRGDMQARSRERMCLVRARKNIVRGEQKNADKDNRCEQFENKFNWIYANKVADSIARRIQEQEGLEKTH